MAQQNPTTGPQQRGATRTTDRPDQDPELMPDEVEADTEGELSETGGKGGNMNNPRQPSGSKSGQSGSSGSSIPQHGSTGDSGQQRERDVTHRDRTSSTGNPSGSGGWSESGTPDSRTGSAQGSSQRGNQPGK